MNDLENRLAAALSAGASEAPPPTGLADGARRRLRARRRTRSVVGAVVAVLLVAVPSGVVLARDGATSPSGPEVATDAVVRDGWRTVSYDGVEVDVPAAWQRLDVSECEFGFEQVGPPKVDPCAQELGISFYPSATFDAKDLPGLRDGEGYVYAGDWAVYVNGADPTVAWRVLASARVAGEEVPDLARGSVELAESGLSATVPADPTGWSVTSTPAAAPRYPTVRERDGRWIGRAGLSGGTMVIDAPTQGLAELIAGSVAPVAGDVVDSWRTETWGEVQVDVPEAWSSGDACRSEGIPVVSRPDGETDSVGPCGSRRMGLGVRFFWSGLSDFIIPILEAKGQAVQVDDDFPEGLFPPGSWIAWEAVAEGDAVFVVTEHRELTQQIVDSVRGPSDRQ